MMALSGRAWPAHPKPLDDELLSSWLVRTARANGLKLQTFCDRVFGKEHQLWNRDIDRSAPEWLLESMCEHTGTPLERVRRTTLDIYRGRLYRRRNAAGQLRWMLPVGVYHRTRRRFGMQFCPQCLADDQEPYFRTLWRVATLTFCPSHRLCLHDRCPACEAPVIFHRRELGRPSIIDSGALSLCHACGLDLRDAERVAFSPYTQDIGILLDQIADQVTGRTPVLDIGHLDVLHQLCKIMVSPRRTASLASHIMKSVAAPAVAIHRSRLAFETRPVAERDHVIQLAAWLLADPGTRLEAAWRARAVRYNHFVRDFPRVPGWYREIVDPFHRYLGRLPPAHPLDCGSKLDLNAIYI